MSDWALPAEATNLTPASKLSSARSVNSRGRRLSGALPRPPALASMPAVQENLSGAALVIYLRDGPGLWALVLAGGSARPRAVGGYTAAHGEATPSFVCFRAG